MIYAYFLDNILNEPKLVGWLGVKAYQPLYVI